MDIPAEVLAPRRVSRLEPLRGGARKAVSRVHCDDGFTCVLYEWSPAAALADPEAAGGPAALAYNHAYLKGLGVRTPAVLHLDPSFALVEDLGARNLVGCGDPAVLRGLADIVARMHGHRGLGWGALASGRRRTEPPCEQVMLDRTLRDIEDLSGRLPALAPRRAPLTAAIERLHAGIRPRQDHRLIHGELGPEHVLVDRDGQPCLIDIEGVRFFDVEYEHSFLAFRYGDRYAALRVAGLDPQRLRFYRLHLHLRYAAGPLAIIDRGYLDAAAMRAIAEANLAAALALLP